MVYVNDIPNDLSNYDIVVGIPSFNNAETIEHVVKMSAKGIQNLGLKGLIVNSDGGSTDGTQEAFMNSKSFGVDKLTIRYTGISGKGSAVRALFEVSDKVNAKAFIMLDSDLRSIEPWWIERLSGPVLSDQTQYVAPLYQRHKYDGTITNNVCYPLTASLYGLKIRQPIGGDFCVGSHLVKIYLSKPNDVWKSHVARFGIDIWMTTIAINESGVKPMQAALGAKIHDAKDPGKHLEGMFIQVVQTLFELMIEYEERWKNVTTIESAGVYGISPVQQLEDIAVDLDNLKKKAIDILKDRKDHLNYLDRDITKRVSKTGTIGIEDWVHTVYSVALKYKETREEETIRDLLGFYFARTADFVEKTRDMSTLEAEALIDEQLEAFKEEKPKIVQEW